VKTGEREEFEILLRELCAGHDKPVGDRSEAYWKGLAKMSLVEFARVIEFALGENGPDKIPTTNQCWRIRNELKRGPAPTQTNLPIKAPPQWTIWHLRVDALFLKYLSERRGAGKFRGDINIAARRKAARDLWEWFDQLEAEFGLQAARDEDLIGRFDRAMLKIEDVSEDDAWLATELARQKQENQEALRA
jgi:hypothetical protein